MEQPKTKNTTTKRLHAAKLADLQPGKHHDGAGLYFVVSRRTPSRAWVYRYGLDGKQHDMGLGAFPEVTLAKARELREVFAAHRAVREDPKAKRDAKAAEERDAIDFKTAAERCIEAISPQWTNPKHAKQVATTLVRYAYPTIGKLKVKAVTTPLVVRCLSPIWVKKRDTANKVRGRIETVLQWAIANGYREGPNPASGDTLKHAGLPRRPKGWKRDHHPGVPYADMPAFVRDLLTHDLDSADALLFLILTGAARTSPVIGARWSEVDVRAKLWSLGAERMKARRDHEAPLTDAALTVLERRRGNGSKYIFPGRAGGHMSNNTMLALMHKTMKRREVPHGFRDSLESWAINAGWHPKVIKAVLAHAPGDDTEAAYGRDLSEAHRKLLEQWAAYVMGGNVVSIERKTA